MTRKFTALAALAMISAFIALDSQATPPNPFTAPPAVALGSGLTQSGGFCGIVE